MSETLSEIKGVGICLRSQHYNIFLADNRPKVPWLEVLADNFLTTSGIAWDKLQLITAHYPIVLHCVGLGLGNANQIDWQYCKKILAIANQLNAHWISDHLCWTAFHGDYTHSLLPLCFTNEVIDHVSQKLIALQSFFGRPILIENIATYLKSPFDIMPEYEFINRVANKSQCGILLDINNLYINAHNHHFDAAKYLAQIDASKVMQYHLAGHQVQDDLLIDTHDTAISDDVFALYKKSLAIVGSKPVCVEWDDHVPEWPALLNETNKVASCLC